jgi:uncharacterized SAM-binding protein YcdF (DUF218 family)
MPEPGLRVDAIVVLGCALDREGKPSDALARRLLEAYGAWRRGVSGTVLVSGGRRWRGRAEAVAMNERLQALGVPAPALVDELSSLSTAQNALHCERIGRPLGLRTVALVTCDFHMARALRLFRARGFLCTPHPAITPGGVTWRHRLRERACDLLDGVVR